MPCVIQRCGTRRISTVRARGCMRRNCADSADRSTGAVSVGRHRATDSTESSLAIGRSTVPHSRRAQSKGLAGCLLVGGSVTRTSRPGRAAVRWVAPPRNGCRSRSSALRFSRGGSSAPTRGCCAAQALGAIGTGRPVDCWSHLQFSSRSLALCTSTSSLASCRGLRTRFFSSSAGSWYAAA